VPNVSFFPNALSKTTVWTWENKPLTRAPFRAVLAGEDPSEAEGWNRLTNRTRQNLLDYKRAASLPACLERAGVSNAAYYKARHEAQACDVLDHLDRYLKMEPPFHDRPQAGLAAPGFFIPTPDMIGFREAAIIQGVGQSVWTNQGMPGFDEWFYDWVVPKPHHGQRIPIQRSAAKPLPPDNQVQELRTAKPMLPSSQQDANGRAHSQAQQPKTLHGKKATPFVPTRFQLSILDSLRGKFLTADQLTTALHCDRSRLYYDGKKKRGLKELSDEGMVFNDRGQGRGYYWPRFPPPEIAAFLGKKRRS
jgi:hypothetical protein